MLWDTFEQMARELECSVDYLINEAMKQYARQRSYGQRTPYPGTQRNESGAGYPSAPPPPMPPPPQSMRNTGGMATTGGMPRGLGGGGLPPPPPRGGGLPAPPPPPRTSPGMQTAGMGGGGLGMPDRGRLHNDRGGMGSRPPTAPRSAPPPIPARAPSMPPIPGPGNSYNGGLGAGGSAALSIIYQGEKVSITKDRFVIGRGKQSSDLTLKDPNVSRQHAMIEYQNGVYFMVDMGSTNGVEYNGQRIARKQIAEGDIFRICDHDLRFTYR